MHHAHHDFVGNRLYVAPSVLPLMGAMGSRRPDQPRSDVKGSVKHNNATLLHKDASKSHGAREHVDVRRVSGAKSGA